MSGGGHYETLGVRPEATAAEIRDAYRALARRHHPDREPADARAMADINEAYRVLGEPSRRAVYDASRRTGSAVAGRSHSPATTASMSATSRPAPLPPARYPWRLAAFMFVVGAAVVLVGAVLYRPKEPAPPDNLLGAGSCVVLEPNGDAREVNCTGAAGELVVQALVTAGTVCPDGAEPHRDRQGRGTACVAPASVP